MLVNILRVLCSLLYPLWSILLVELRKQFQALSFLVGLKLVTALLSMDNWTKEIQAAGIATLRHIPKSNSDHPILNNKTTANLHFIMIVFMIAFTQIILKHFRALR